MCVIFAFQLLEEKKTEQTSASVGSLLEDSSLFLAPIASLCPQIQHRCLQKQFRL